MPESEVAASSVLSLSLRDPSSSMNLDQILDGRSSRPLPLLFFQQRTFTLGPQQGWNPLHPCPTWNLIGKATSFSTNDPSRPSQLETIALS